MYDMYYITAFLFMQCEFFLKNGLKSIDIFFFNAIIDKQKINKVLWNMDSRSNLRKTNTTGVELK